MKNYINNSKISLISSLVTVTAVIAVFAMPASAMAGGSYYGNYGNNGGYASGYGHNSGYSGSGHSYYPVSQPAYYPSGHSSPVNVNTNTNVNTTVQTTPTTITINNNNNVSGGGYAQPVYYSQPIVYTEPVYNQPIVYSNPTYTYPTYAYGQSYDYAPTYYQDYNTVTPLDVTCSANVSFAPVGSMVLWTASVSGGNGYYTYQWSGSDQIYGSNASTDVSYNTAGQKYAAVTVYSNGQSISVTCSDIVTVGVKDYTDYNNGYTNNTNANANAVNAAPRVVTRTIIRNAPAVSTAVATTSNAGLSANSIFSLANIPWGWVAVLIILVLFGTVLYLLFNKSKI